MSGTDRIQFLEMLMFNFLIGNGDAHAKNFSILYEDKYAILAPFYDLMSTILYAPFALTQNSHEATWGRLPFPLCPP